MKVFALKPNEGWIVDRIVDEWRSVYEDSTKSPQDADVIWLAADWCWKNVDISLLESRCVVTTIHHIVPEKFGQVQLNEFRQRDKITNAYHCPNFRTAEFLTKNKLTQKPITVVPYWCNDALWNPKLVDRSSARLQFGLTNEFVISSFQRDTEGKDLKSPKLEKGPDLLCDAIEKIASQRSDVKVLLGGWRRQYVIDRLTTKGIPILYFELPNDAMIRSMYAATDLYIVSARHEGGPQAILEAASMRTPIISRPVGLAEAVLHESSINEDLSLAIPNVEYAAERVAHLNILDVKRTYVDLFMTAFKHHRR
jgi:glycosyltransferase involved in cell wall biosynthesis